jgi:hypothetical protein
MLLPEPPFHTSIGVTEQTVVTVVMAVLAGAAMVCALGHRRRTGRLTLLMLFVSGGAMMLFEPMVDTVGAVWFPRGTMWVAFHAYGRPIPVWLCLCYFAYFGILVGGVWLALQQGVTRRKLWTMWAGCVVADLILEVTLLHFDAYYYYGHAPLRVLKFPLWWPPVNALIVVVAAGAVHRLDDHLRGRRQLLIVPIALTASASTNAAAGWPSWLVINSDLGPVLTQVGGIATWGLVLWLMSGLVAVLIAGEAATPPPGSVRAPEAAAPRVPEGAPRSPSPAGSSRGRDDW